MVLAMSRAVGETMIVTIAAGGNPQFLVDPLQAVQTMTAMIVQLSLGGHADDEHRVQGAVRGGDDAVRDDAGDEHRGGLGVKPVPAGVRMTAAAATGPARGAYRARVRARRLLSSTFLVGCVGAILIGLALLGALVFDVVRDGGGGGVHVGGDGRAAGGDGVDGVGGAGGDGAAVPGAAAGVCAGGGAGAGVEAAGGGVDGADRGVDARAVRAVRGGAGRGRIRRTTSSWRVLGTCSRCWGRRRAGSLRGLPSSGS